MAEAGHRLTDVVPGAQANGEVVAAPALPVLPADQQVVLLAAHVAEAQCIAGDAANVLDGVEPGLLGLRLVASGATALHALPPPKWSTNTDEPLA